MMAYQKYNDLLKRLHQYRQKEKSIHFAISFSWWIIITLVSIFLLIFLEYLLWFSPTVKQWIGISVLLFGVIGFFLYCVLPLFNLLFRKNVPDDVTLSLKISQLIPDVNDQLADALQVFEAVSHDEHDTSAELSGLALSQIYQKVKSYQFTQFLSVKKCTIFCCITCLILLSEIVLILLIPGLSSGLNRMVHYNQYFEKPKSVIFKVSPGNVQHIKGDTLDVRIEILRGESIIPYLYFQFEGKSLQKIRLKKPYVYSIPKVQTPGSYWIEANGDQSEHFQIEILKRPFIHSFQWQAQPPTYAQLEEQIWDVNEGNLNVLKGSRLSLILKSTKVLSKADLLWNNIKQPLQIRKHTATGGLIISEPAKYYFNVQDTMGIQNTNAILYQVNFQPDQYPIVHIRSPQKQVDLTEQLILPLSIEAEDDYGLLKMQLKYWIQMPGDTQDKQDTCFVEIPLINLNQKYLLQSFSWDLKHLNLFPEDVIHYFIQIADNDEISGPKWSRSDIHFARFPSIYEIFEEIEEEHAHQIDSFEDQYEESKALLDVLENIERDIKTGQDVTWEEKHELTEALKKQQDMQNDVDALKQDLQQMVSKMEENQLMDSELFEKYQELQDLYQEIATPELLEAMQKFGDMLQNMKTPDLQKAVEQMKVDQEQMIQSLERTIELLKRIQTEQKMDEVIQKTENMLQRQDAINQSLQQKTNIDSTITRQQQNLTKDNERLLDDLSELQKMMSDFQNMPNKEMDDFLDSLKQSEHEQMFQQMQKKMEQNNQFGAQEQGKQIQQSLESMKQQLSEMQEAMSQKSQKEIAQAFQDISHKLMQASHEQERLSQKSGKKSDSQNDLAQDQQSLQRFTQSISDSLKMLSQKTMGVTPEMFQALAKAQSKMRDATQSLGNRQQNLAMSQQNQAMGALNQALLAMQNAMNQMSMQGGSGLEQFMNQMNQMTQQQMALNQQLMQMLQQGHLSMAQQAALERMAARQQAIQRSMQEMMKQFGSQGEHMGKLDRLIEEMQESINEMHSSQVDRKTLERQEKILSRMLDAQRSIREKDYSKQRKGHSGQDVYRQSPSKLKLSESELRKMIQKELLRLSEQGFSEEDQQLIRDYFNVLLKESSK